MKNAFLATIIFTASILISSSFAADDKLANQPMAKKACLNSNESLPSAREMAAFAMSHGAVGILEPADYHNQEGFKPINKLIADYKAELDFYYNPTGYISPEPGLKTSWYWTGSNGPLNIDFGYIFNMKTGKFDFDARIMKNAFRCVKN